MGFVNGRLFRPFSQVALTKDLHSVTGWIRSIRRHKNVTFASVSSSLASKEIQLVLDANTLLDVGAAIRAHGTMQPSLGQGQSQELRVEQLEVLGPCPGELYPIQKKVLEDEFLRSIPHLRSRTSRYATILRLRSSLSMSFRNWLEQRECLEIHAPVLSFSDCEGGGEAFSITDGPSLFTGKEAYLSVSAQLHAEAAAMALGRVYTFGPIFRAEKHRTRRHLAEFTMLEVELAFVDTVQELMDFCESMIREAAGSLKDSFPVFEERRCSLERSFARVCYSQVIDALKEAHNKEPFKFEPIWGEGLHSEHERYICEQLYQGTPTFVYDYPRNCKAFYMRVNEDPATVACFDLLFPHVGEICGGSIREERFVQMEESIRHFGLRSKNYDWYLDLRRFGSAPHGGFGLGFDRIVQYLTGMGNIRDVVLFPRAVDSANC